MNRCKARGLGTPFYLFDYMKQDGHSPVTVFTDPNYGLTGEVSKRAWGRIVKGRDPKTNETLIKHQRYQNRKTNAYFEISGNRHKSIEQIAVLGGERGKRDAIGADEYALQKMVSYLEAKAFVCRTGRGGIHRERVKPTILFTRHERNREDEPNGHYHIPVPIGARCADGKFRKFDSRTLFRHMRAASYVYHAAQAKYLRDRGYRIERDENSFRIVGTSEELSDFWSTRRKQVKEATERFGTSEKGRQKAAFATRKAKSEVAQQEVEARWCDEGLRFGMGEKDVAALRGPEPPPIGEAKVQSILEAAARDLGEVKSHFAERDFVAAVARIGQWEGAGPLVEEAELFLKHSASIVQLGTSRTGEGRFATKRNWEREREVLDWAKAHLDDHGFEVGHQAVRTGVRRAEKALGYSLSPEQLKMVEYVVAEPGRIRVVDGRAGSGKTSGLRACQEIWKGAGFKAIGLSRNAKAAAEIEERSGIKSASIAKLLFEHGQGPTLKPSKSRWKSERDFWLGRETGEERADNRRFHGVEKQRLANRTRGFDAERGLRAARGAYATWHISKAELRHRERQHERRERFFVDERTVLVVDEGATVDSKSFAALVELARETGAKLVSIGDPKQTQAIGPGGMHNGLGDTVGRVELKENWRQEEDWSKETVAAVRSGDGKEALEAFRKRELLTLGADEFDTLEKMVRDWEEAGGAERPADHFFIADRHQRVDALNRAAQASRKSSGHLSKRGVTSGDSTFYKGDRVTFTVNDPRLGVRNGDLGTVRSASGRSRRVDVRLDTGPDVTVSLSAYRFLKLGYARTGHSSQSLTLQNAYVWLGGDLQDQQLAYVELSRASGTTHLYASLVEAERGGARLKYEVSRERTDSLAHGISTERERS